MPEVLSLEDNSKVRDEIPRGEQTALDHAWTWWKYHADQRITLMKFYIVSLGGIAAGIGLLHQQKEHVLSAILSAFGAFLSFCFIRLDTRTSDLVKIGETALAHEHKRMALQTENEAMHLCIIADRKVRYWPYSYGQVIAAILSVIIGIFVLMLIVSLRLISLW
jgi:uncharacterized membrane protein YfcA